MRTNLPRILKLTAAAIGSRRGVATPVTLKWMEVSGGTVDPLSGGFVGGTATEQTKPLRGFVHIVQIAQGQVRQFNEVEHGDAIVDLPAAADIAGLTDLRFEFDGSEWVQKDVSKELAKSWDVIAGGQKIFRTVLLKKAT